MSANLSSRRRDTVEKILNHESSGNVETRTRDYGDGRWGEPR